MIRSSFGKNNFENVDFLEEDLPKEVTDYIRDHLKDIRVNERYAQIMVSYRVSLLTHSVEYANRI